MKFLLRARVAYKQASQVVHDAGLLPEPGVQDSGLVWTRASPPGGGKPRGAAAGPRGKPVTKSALARLSAGGRAKHGIRAAAVRKSV
mmetsp:Transcript_5319/g.15059  ORF Transcript_5319/g.15059 Transcript_5319/m.15059 type:complete len:87 (+) Transcript_5319:82-342(+)